MALPASGRVRHHSSFLEERGCFAVPPDSRSVPSVVIGIASAAAVVELSVRPFTTPEGPPTPRILADSIFAADPRAAANGRRRVRRTLFGGRRTTRLATPSDPLGAPTV